MNLGFGSMMIGMYLNIVGILSVEKTLLIISLSGTFIICDVLIDWNKEITQSREGVK